MKVKPSASAASAHSAQGLTIPDRALRLGIKRARYVRRMSALERLSLIIHEVYRYHVDGILEGRGAVSPELLQAAVDRAAAANPAIRVRLRGFLGFSRWVDSGIAPQVRMLPLSAWDGCSERAAPFLMERLEPMRGGPIADVLIVPCTDGMTRLVFRTVHAATDGRGLGHWAMEVCRAMRGEPLQAFASTLTDFEIQAQYADRIVQLPPTPPASYIPVVAPSATARQPLGYIWRRAVIDHKISQMLPKTALFLARWARLREAGEVAFTIPVDYRGLRTQEVGIGNLTGYLRVTVPEEASPRTLMHQLHSQLRGYADCRPLPGGRRLFRLPLWYILRKIRPKIDGLLYTVTPELPSGGIVSMGNLTADAFAFPGFDVTLAFGIPGAVGKLNVLFFNYPEFTAITFAAPAAYNAEGQLDALVAAYQQHFSSTGRSR